MKVPLKNSHWVCYSHRPLHTDDLLVLTNLYQPLTGAVAISLYLTLYSQLPLHKAGLSVLCRRSLLLKTAVISDEDWNKSRQLLEGIGLINTYEVYVNENELHHEYELLPPLSAQKFFESDILAVNAYNLLGAVRFSSLKESLLCDSRVEHLKLANTVEKNNITQSFQAVFGQPSVIDMQNSPKTVAEPVLLDIPEIEGKPPIVDSFDWSSVQLRLGSTVNPGEWTDEFRRSLDDLRFLYNSSEKDLIKFLQNPYITQKGKVDLDRLKSYMKNEYRWSGRVAGADVKSPASLPVSMNEPESANIKASTSQEEDHIAQLSNISPMQLLKYYQKGSYVPEADIELVQSLQNDFGLEPGVINVLLEYVLLKYNYKLPRSLVEKIAGHWKRVGITTVEEAFAQAKGEGASPKVTKEPGLSTRRTERSYYREDILPKSMQAPEKTAQSEVAATTNNDLVETQARIREKLSKMRQQQHQKLREKGLMP